MMHEGEHSQQGADGRKFNLLGRRLKEARGNRSGREIARATGISPMYYSSLERGFDSKTKKPHRPSREITLGLANALNIDPEELIGISGRDTEELESGTINYPRALLKATISAFRHAETEERESAARILSETGSIEGLTGFLYRSAAYGRTAGMLKMVLEGFEERITKEINDPQD